MQPREKASPPLHGINSKVLFVNQSLRKCRTRQFEFTSSFCSSRLNPALHPFPSQSVLVHQAACRVAGGGNFPAPKRDERNKEEHLQRSKDLGCESGVGMPRDLVVGVSCVLLACRGPWVCTPWDPALLCHFPSTKGTEAAIRMLHVGCHLPVLFFYEGCGQKKGRKEPVRAWRATGEDALIAAPLQRSSRPESGGGNSMAHRHN